jgi:prolyl oligopeptidase
VHVLYGSAGDRTEVHVQNLAERGPVVAIVNELPARFFGTIAGDQLFLHTNWKAPKGRILGVDLKAPSRDHWREVVPESDAVIENVDALGGRLGVLFTENASSRVKLVEPSGKLVREISLPRIGSVTGLTGRWSSQEAFYQFESFHIPQRIYRYDVVKGTQEMWAQVQAPIESDKYEVKQVWYASKDGTKVPMFLVYARGIKLDGSNPTLLTGYGGFNVSETPSYTTRAAAWISSGGIYALANMRGGGEFGEEWHRAGMLANKQNVFDDFIAAAEWLVKNNYTRPSRLAIRGASNGGLLVGAALTQRPDLFGAVVCGYPLLDMLRYHKFLVARWWVPEYGSSDDAEQFKFIYAYSPYQQVKPGGKYPAVLLISGDSDTRVDPLHARKMTARLQAATAFRQTILLHYDTKAGHSGGTPISKQVDDLTDELSFLFWRLGVSPAPANR